MKILIPLDGSQFAEAILTPAVRLAAASKAEVHLLRVVNPLQSATTEAGGLTQGLPCPEPMNLWMFARRSSREGADAVPVETVGQAAEKLRQAAAEYLEDIAQRFFPDGATKKVVTGVNPAKEITEYARREKVTLIAMATHGRTGMAQRILGSIAGELLRVHPGPIFLVRPEELN